MLWVNDDVSARGTTDIKTPLMQALRMLKSTPAHPDEIRLPLVFLLTDGATCEGRLGRHDTVPCFLTVSSCSAQWLGP